MPVTLSARLPSVSIGTTQEPAHPAETLGGLDSTTATTATDMLDSIAQPAPVDSRKCVLRLDARSLALVEFLIGHATTPVGKSATAYIVAVREKVAAPAEPVVFKRTQLAEITVTGDRAITAGEIAAQPSRFAGFAAWASCSLVVAADYTPTPPGLLAIGTGAADNSHELIVDTLGASFLEIWVTNAAGSQGVAVDYRQA